MSNSLKSVACPLTNSKHAEKETLYTIQFTRASKEKNLEINTAKEVKDLLKET